MTARYRRAGDGNVAVGGNAEPHYGAECEQSIPPDLGFFPRLTVSNPSWWLAFVACLSVALIVTRSWSGRPILWIGLAVTELVPIGFLAFNLVQMNKLPRLGLGPGPPHQGHFHPPGTP